MKVSFELVRIGKFRKSFSTERALKVNTINLKKAITFFIKNELCYKKDIEMVLIIPEKGQNIKIVLDDIRDFNVKKELKKKFPKSIYKENYSKILININNKIFPITI